MKIHPGKLGKIERQGTLHEVEFIFQQLVEGNYLSFRIKNDEKLIYKGKQSGSTTIIVVIDPCSEKIKGSNHNTKGVG
jgi:hypothetical protein